MTTVDEISAVSDRFARFAALRPEAAQRLVDITSRSMAGVTFATAGTDQRDLQEEQICERVYRSYNDNRVGSILGMILVGVIVKIIIEFIMEALR